MAFTDAGVYYPTNSDNVSTVDAFQAFAESASARLNIVQVAHADTSTFVTNTSSSTYVASGLSISITPKFATSNILILVTLPFVVSASTGNIFGDSWAEADFRLNRDASQLIEQRAGFSGLGYGTNAAVFFKDSLNVTYLDSPASTTALTYTVEGKMRAGSPPPLSQILYMNYADGVAAKSSIIALEVLQ